MDYIVKYKDVIIGDIINGKYIPNKEGVNKCNNDIFSFLKNEIEDITTINFFTSRIKNCSRFKNLDIAYSTDNYILIEK